MPHFLVLAAGSGALKLAKSSKDPKSLLIEIPDMDAPTMKLQEEKAALKQAALREQFLGSMPRWCSGVCVCVELGTSAGAVLVLIELAQMLLKDAKLEAPICAVVIFPSLEERVGINPDDVRMLEAALLDYTMRGVTNWYGMGVFPQQEDPEQLKPPEKKFGNRLYGE